MLTSQAGSTKAVLLWWQTVLHSDYICKNNHIHWILSHRITQLSPYMRSIGKGLQSSLSAESNWTSSEEYNYSPSRGK